MTQHAMIRFLTCGALAIAMASAGCAGSRSVNDMQQTAGDTDRPSQLVVVIVGDSTVKTYKPETAIYGWGQMMPELFDDTVRFINLAEGGRSSKSFIGEGRLARAVARKPDYLLIQFGHNDCPGKGERETDPNSDYMTYLRTYIDDARAIGATPILITPMTRRKFGPDGRIQTILTPYADAMKRVGAETNTTVIDLHTKSVELFNRLGDAGSADLSCSENDRTHFSSKGARTMARMIVEDLPPGDLADRRRLTSPGQAALDCQAR